MSTNHSYSGSSEVNLAKFSAALRTHRGNRGLRDVASEIGGVSASTLSRIEQGNVPDLDTFMRVCAWLGTSPEDFTGPVKAQEPSDSVRAIEAHLRADQVLPAKTIEALSEMIRLAYDAAKQGKIKDEE